MTPISRARLEALRRLVEVDGGCQALDLICLALATDNCRARRRVLEALARAFTRNPDTHGPARVYLELLRKQRAEL